jgi:hypothetical protein
MMSYAAAMTNLEFKCGARAETCWHSRAAIAERATGNITQLLLDDAPSPE